MVGVGLDQLGELEAIVDALIGLDTSLLADAGLAETFIDVRRSIDRLEAVAAGLLAAVDGRGIAYVSGASSTPAWVQWQTGQRACDAKASLVAGKAAGLLPRTHKASAAGRISASAARTICRGVREGHEQVYAEIEKDLVDAAEARSFRSVDAIIRHYSKYCDALDGREPSDRNGCYLSEIQKRWQLNANLDELAGKTLKDAIDAATDTPTEGDERTPAKRRADALVRIARFFLDHEKLPMEGGEAPHVSLVFTWEEIRSSLPIPNIRWDATDFDTLISRADRDRILCDCNIARIILGPDSKPLDVGSEQRIVPLYLRRALTHRDRGCDRPAKRCEAHHVIPWWNGGPTSLANCILLCSFHHHVVHRVGWTNTFDGLTYEVHNEHGTTVPDPAARWRRQHSQQRSAPGADHQPVECRSGSG